MLSYSSGPSSVLSKLHSYYSSAERFRNTETKVRVLAPRCSEIGIRHALLKSFVGCQGLRFLKTWNLDIRESDIFSRSGSYPHAVTASLSRKRISTRFSPR